MDGVKLAVFSTDFGWMCAATNGPILCELTFNHQSPGDAVQRMKAGGFPSDPDPWSRQLIGRLQAFCRNPADDFLDIEVDLTGHTDFQRRVVECCRAIKAGFTLSYGELAERAGNPGAARAVGRVMAMNRFPLIVPCHRIVASNGTLGGYSAPEGLSLKQRLLDLEAQGPRCKKGVASATH